MSSGSNAASLMSRMVAFELACRFTDEEVRLGVSVALGNLRAALASNGLCNGPRDSTFFDRVLSGSASTAEVVPYVMARAEDA